MSSKKSYKRGRGTASGQRRSSGNSQRKTLQLCKQIEHTLSYVLSGETEDDLIRELYVVSVDPAPNASHLLVTVASLNRASDIDPAETMARLHKFAPMIREEVAASIHRRYVPELSFRIALQGLGDQPPGSSAF